MINCFFFSEFWFMPAHIIRKERRPASFSAIQQPGDRSSIQDNHNHPLLQKGHGIARSIIAAIRVVLYLRMSSERQEDSIDRQQDELLRYATRLGYRILGEYRDEAISGDKTDRRSGFLALRDAAERGEFDVVLAWDQDRFGRFDPLDAGYWIYPSRRAGVRFETIAQGPIAWEDLTQQLVE